MHRRVSQPASKPEHPQSDKHSRKSIFLLGCRVNADSKKQNPLQTRPSNPKGEVFCFLRCKKHSFLIKKTEWREFICEQKLQGQY